METKTALFYKDYEVLEREPKRFKPGSTHKRLSDDCLFTLEKVFFDASAGLIAVSLYREDYETRFDIKFFEFRLNYEHCEQNALFLEKEDDERKTQTGFINKPLIG